MNGSPSLEQAAWTRWKSVPEEKLFFMMHFYQRAVWRKYPHAKAMFVNDRHGNRAYVGIFNAPLDLNHKLNFESRKQASPQLLGRLFYYSDNYPELAKQRIICEAWLMVAYESRYGKTRERTWETSCDGIQR
jgi:hypothetical protein